MSFKSSQRSQWGRWAEEVVARWLRSEGWYVTQTCKIEDGGAPKAIGAISAHVLPDNLCSKNGFSRWGETKFKDSPTFFRARNELRHGVDLNNWNDYLRVETETGIPGDLFLLEWRPNVNSEPRPLLLTMSFRQARNVPVQEIPAGVQSWAPHGMIYWARKSFETLHEFDSDEFLNNRPLPETTKETLRRWRELEIERAKAEGFFPLQPRRRWA